MRKLKLKRHVMSSALLMIGVFIMTIAFATPKTLDLTEEEQLNYVSNTIISRDIAVINTTQKMINPYIDQSVSLGKAYYDYKDSSENQEKSIIYHEDTYIQNSGVDFVYENSFNVVSVLDGTVTNVKEDELLGKVIEITHANDYISVYQSLSAVNVTKGDLVNQGQIIGTSGTNNLDKDLGNHLHFELYIGGQIVKPTDYLDKEISLKNN